MAKVKNSTLEAIELRQTDQAIFMKATRPLTQREHEEVSQRLRYESENTGLRIVLVPYSVDLVDGEE